MPLLPAKAGGAVVEGDSEADSISEKVPDRVPSLMRAVTSRRKHKPAARPHVVVQTSESGDSIVCAPQNLHSPRPRESSSKLQTSVTEQGKTCTERKRRDGGVRDRNCEPEPKEKEFHQERDEEGDQVFAADFSPHRPYHSPLRVETRNARPRDSQ